MDNEHITRMEAVEVIRSRDNTYDATRVTRSARRIHDDMLPIAY